MASAERSPDNKRVDIVTRFNERYTELLEEARVHQKHTATEGWQRLFLNFKRETRDRLSAVAKSLRSKADTIELVGSYEDLEKEIGEEKKSLALIRTEISAFDVSTISPVKQCVLDCQQLITESLSQARRQEQDAPLVNVGLEHLMRDAISAVAKVSWDDETGVVVINGETNGQ